jgi:hypothetical protein
MFKYAYPILAAAILFSCKDVEKKSAVMGDTSQNKIAVEPVSTAANSILKEVTTSTGKTVLIEESHPKGQSLSDITIQFKGDSTTRLSLTDKDPISAVFIADLNKDKFDEVYIISTAAGSGSYGTVHGFSSNRDLSFSMIYFPVLEEKDLKEGLLKGYSGHDAYQIEGQELIRTFAVSTDNKERKSVAYRLRKSETGYVLVAER